MHKKQIPILTQMVSIFSNSENSKATISQSQTEKSSNSEATKGASGNSNISATSISSGTSGPRPGMKPIPMQRQISRETDIAEAINTVLINRDNVKRGRLDKSHSTPAYDDDGKLFKNYDPTYKLTNATITADIPPAIEPRKEHLFKAPPVPPPRPKKTLESSNINLVPEKPPPPSPALLAAAAALSAPTTPADLGFISPQQASVSSADHGEDNNKSKLANLVDLKNRDTTSSHGEPPPSPFVLSPPPKPAERIVAPPRRVPVAKHFLEGPLEPPSELLTPNKTKGLTLKKKNSILSKRRNVSLKTLCVSDIQGHLYRRTKDSSGLAYWAKYYFVLIDTTLYGFKSKDSHKANSMVFLSGFTISLAKEVHSKPYAFKVYHPNKTFYFAAETQEALGQWMEYIKQATLKGNVWCR